MQVICKDGTRIHCQDFEATDSGVLFFQERSEENGDEQEADERRSAAGFIPVTELRFVLPDEMARQQAMSQQSNYPQQGHGTAMSGGMQRQGGHAPQQQQMQQSSGPSHRGPTDSSGR